MQDFAARLVCMLSCSDTIQDVGRINKGVSSKSGCVYSIGKFVVILFTAPRWEVLSEQAKDLDLYMSAGCRPHCVG